LPVRIMPCAAGAHPANPARGLGLPRIQRCDYVFLTHDQVRDLASEAEPWRVLVLLLGYTGLRWAARLAAEMMALLAATLDRPISASTGLRWCPS
jgi:hypothetical protein